MTQVMTALFPLLSLILMGYVLNRSKFLGKEFWSGADRLNYYLLFPALLFSSIYKANIHIQTIQQVAWALMIMFVVACSILYLVKYIKHLRPQQFGVYTQGVLRFNTYIGISVITVLLGNEGKAILAIILALTIPVVNIISIMALLPKERFDLLKVSLALVKNPLITSCILAALLKGLNIHVFSGVDELIRLLSVSSLPLGLLCVGAALNFLELRQNVNVLLVNSVTRLLLMPALALLVCYLLHMPILLTTILVIFFALPTAPTAYALTRQYHADSHMMAGIISLQTLLSAITLPLVIFLIQ